MSVEHTALVIESRRVAATRILTDVAAALCARGHDATMIGNRLDVGEQNVALVLSDGRIFIRAALAWDGFTMRTALGDSTLTPGGRLATVARVLGAIEARIIARVDAPIADPALSRDPCEARVSD